MKIEILFPTPTEARDFRHSGVGTHVSGVGIPVTLLLPTLIRRAGTTPVLPWSFALLTISGWAGVTTPPTVCTASCCTVPLTGAVMRRNLSR